MLANQKSTLLCTSAALFLILLLLLAGCSDPGAAPPEEEEVEEEEENEEEEEEEEEPTVDIAKVSPVTVIINNHPAARPQSGLQQATYVYEFLVEGSMTRFLAVYDTPFNDNFLIGPVRSLRPYFAVQALEYGGAIAHSGFSQRTAGIIQGMGLKQITSSNHLWRDSSRRAPHNLYTDIENLYQGAGTDLSGVEEKEIILEDCPANYEKGLEIEVIYSNSSNRVTYTYDEEKEVYLRFINDNPHLDRETEEQYRAHRVIIRKTPHQSIPGPEGLVEINLEGEGEGLLYEGGKKFHIRWEKKNDVTSYFYQTGNPVETRWGNTWIQVVKSNQ